MQPKDYYKILNVSPTAGVDEIRKAFRTLALKYHPDRNNGDKYKEALFREVQEAYQTLADPKTREEYNYKRWYTRSLGKRFHEQANSPQQIQAEAQQLADYVSSVNNLQIDYDLLSSRIRSVLSGENIEILRQFNDSAVNERIIKVVLRTTDPLPARYVEPICFLLAQVAGSSNHLLIEIKSYQESRFSTEYWQKRTGLLVVLLTLLICWLMYIYAS